MPSLAELTDAYPQPDQSLPVERLYVTTGRMPEDGEGGRPLPIVNDIGATVDYPRPEPRPEPLGDSKLNLLAKGIENLLGGGTEERYKLWPEKLIRSGISAAHDVMSGETPQWAIDPASGDVHTSPQMTEKALDMSALAGTGGLMGTTDASLGSAPFLRPALKYGDKIYKAPQGGQHLDALPAHLADEFNRLAMSGEDINHYKFGFMNEKGQFLDREKALEHAINTGLVDPHTGQYGALTSTLLADSSKPGAAIESLAKSQPFYSALEHGINKLPDEALTGEQWLSKIWEPETTKKVGVRDEKNKVILDEKGQPKTKDIVVQGKSPLQGVKQEELEWTGLKDFLEENKDKTVTKEQVQEHLQNNKVELKEVNKSALDKPINETKVEGFSGPTKYHSYQLAGGTNYREMLLTLPSQNKMKWERTPEGITAEGYTIKKEPNGYVTYGSNGRKLSLHDSEEMAKSLVETSKSNSPNTNIYRTSHWDEPNILAHVRMNDRMIEGKKSLHLEEGQSDWHQKGSSEGYKNNLSENETIELKKLRDKVENGTLNGDDAVRVSELENKKAAYGGVPNAPFKGMEKWSTLILKRMIREASEKGYDRLSWTPGEAQAARYDLSKQLDTVRADPKKDGTFTLSGTKNNNLAFEQKNIPADKVADFVGKDVAEKLLKSEKNKYGMHELSGLDLKIGGKFHKKLYDELWPKILEKIGKEYGVKVKEGLLPSDNIRKTVDDRYTVVGDKRTFDTLEEAQKIAGHKIHYIDLPQSLKDQALHKGFPLFSGKYMFVPTDHDPFEKKENE